MKLKTAIDQRLIVLAQMPSFAFIINRPPIGMRRRFLSGHAKFLTILGGSLTQVPAEVDG